MFLAVEHRDGRFPPALARDALGVGGIGAALILLDDLDVRDRFAVDVPRDVLELPLLQGRFRGEVDALHAETVHRGGHARIVSNARGVGAAATGDGEEP